MTRISPQFGQGQYGQTLAPKKRPQPTPNPILFSGAGSSGGSGDNGLKRLLRVLMLSLIPLMPMAGTVSAQTQDVNSVRDAGYIVNSIREGIQTNNAELMFQDLLENPMVSPAARARIVDAIQRFNATQIGQLGVTIIPGGTSDLETLGVGIINEAEMGNAGKNNAILFLVNAENVREAARSGRMYIVPGHGMKNVFSRNVAIDILKSEAVPALNRNDYEAAIENTVDAIIAYAERDAAERQARAERENRPKEPMSQETKDAIMYTLLGLLALIGVGTGGYLARRRYLYLKQREANTEGVNRALKSMGSKKSVANNNVYSLGALNKLLDVETVNEDVNADLVVQAVQAILPNLESEDVPESLEIVLAKGLVHPIPEVRVKSVKTLLLDGMDDDEYDAFLDLLKAEEDSRVIAELVGPMTEHAKQENLESFKEFTGSHKPGLRRLGTQVMMRYADASTMDHFFEMLAKEENDDLIKLLQNNLVDLSDRSNVTQLDAKFVQGNDPEVREAALSGLAKVGDPDRFGAVWESFLGNQNRQLKEEFREALRSMARKEHQATLFDGLQNESVRIQRMSIDILDRLAIPDAVDPLIAYLETEDTKLPDEATAALLKSVNRSHLQQMLDIIESHEPETDDVEVMMAAIKAVQKVDDGHSIDELAEAMSDSKQSPHVRDLLLAAMEDSPHNEQSFDFLTQTLLHSPVPATRSAAALTLDDYGLEALSPLFDALGNVDGSTPVSELNTLKKAIRKVGRDDSALEIFLGYSLTGTELVREIAGSAAASIIDKWDDQYDYDNGGVIARLKTLKEHGNSLVNSKADHVYGQMVDDKVEELQRLGRRGDFHRSSNYNKCESYYGDPETSIDQAARAANRKLKSRLREYEEEQRRKREEEARRAREAARAAARRRRQRASSSSSSYSSSSWSSGGGGGWGGGGGFSSGGGGGI